MEVSVGALLFLYDGASSKSNLELNSRWVVKCRLLLLNSDASLQYMHAHREKAPVNQYIKEVGFIVGYPIAHEIYTV